MSRGQIPVRQVENLAAFIDDRVAAAPDPAMDAIEAHLIDPTPHPVYDDMLDLTLLFENGLI